MTNAYKGAAFLDEARPGWHDELDLETLDIALPHHCALGQLYGRYQEGLKELGIFGRGPELGFSGIAPYLNKEWREEILMRRLRDERRKLFEEIIANSEELDREPALA